MATQSTRKQRDTERLTRAASVGGSSHQSGTRRAQADVDRGAATAPKTILFLDDDEDFIGLVVPALRRRGHTVIVSRSGAHATLEAEQHKPDMIIVDGLLPDVDGVSWIAAQRTRDPKTPIVFVSAFWGFVESLHRLTEQLKVTLVVHKPVDVTAFCEQLEACDDERDARPPVQLGPAADDEEAMSTARAEYARMLPSKLEDLAHRIARARANPGDAFLVGEVRWRSHKLRGTAGCYGFADVGAAAGDIEDALENLVPPAGEPGIDTWQLIDEALVRARRVVERSIRELSRRRGTPIGVDGGRILVIAADPVFVASLEDVGRAQLVEIIRVPHVAEALSTACKSPPDAAIIELRPSARDVSFALAAQLRTLAGSRPFPIAFVSETGSVSARAAAARAGGALYLTRPMDVEMLGLAVRQLLASAQATSPRVAALIQPASAQCVAAALERRGMSTTLLPDAENVLEVLDEVRPGLLLLDLDVPRARDLCTVVRTSLSWQHLALVATGSGLDRRARLDVQRSAVDGVIAKPLDERELIACVEAHLCRHRLLHERFDRDALTDLPLRRPFLERLGRSMAESLRHSRPLTVALIDVDLFKLVNDEHGHQVGDRVLSSLARLLTARLRAEDLRGRWGGEEFVLASPGEAAGVSGMLQELLMDFGAVSFRGNAGKSFSVTFSVGVANYPADGASIQALLGAADRRLYLAKRCGRARVVTSG